MKWPVDITKYPITQKFGERPDIYKRFGLFGHNGIDIGCPTGTTLIAPISGTILETTDNPEGYGLYIKIQNDKEGVVLAHNKKFLVKVGDWVNEGQEVVISGNTGFTTGSHSHFGYYPIPRDRTNGYNGFIDQLPFLNEPLKMTLDDETFKKLVKNSTNWDETVKYLEITTDPKDTSFQQIQDVIAGIRSATTACQNTLTIRDQDLQVAQVEISNRGEELARKENDCQLQVKFLNSQIDSLDKQLKIAQEPQGEMLGQIGVLRGQIDELSKEKGRLLKQIAIQPVIKCNHFADVGKMIAMLFTKLVRK